MTCKSSDSLSHHQIACKLDEHAIVPDVIDTHSSIRTAITIKYANGAQLKLGNQLTPRQVSAQPSIVDWNAQSNALYTLSMTDPDAPSRRSPTAREWRHWLVVNIPGNDIVKGDVLTPYAGSTPPTGTGLHRYVFLVYKQPNKLVIEDKFDDSRTRFRIKVFAHKYGLGEPIAANFYLAKSDK